MGEADDESSLWKDYPIEGEVYVPTKGSTNPDGCRDFGPEVKDRILALRDGPCSRESVAVRARRRGRGRFSSSR